MTASPQLHQSTARYALRDGNGLVLGLCVVSAGLLVASGAIHLRLWQEYYRDITTGHMNVLFMVQAVAAFVGAAALLAIRHWLVAVGCAALMAGTAVGYLIARYHSGGLFGFVLPGNFASSDATSALTVEIIATVLLAVTAVVMSRQRA